MLKRGFHYDSLQDGGLKNVDSLVLEKGSSDKKRFVTEHVSTVKKTPETYLKHFFDMSMLHI
jgi:hypothetical protein